MQTRGALIADALDRFLAACPDVDGAAVVSTDGLPMASALPLHLEEERLAAMSAALLSLGERAAEHLGRGRLRQLFLEGEMGFVYLMAAGPHAVLCAISRPSAKTGLILYEMKAVSRIVGDALATPAAPPAPAIPATSAVTAVKQAPVPAAAPAVPRPHPAPPLRERELARTGGRPVAPVAPSPGLHAVQPPGD